MGHFTEIKFTEKIPPKVELKHGCPLCSQKFSDENERIKHIQNVHSIISLQGKKRNDLTKKIVEQPSKKAKIGENVSKGVIPEANTMNRLSKLNVSVTRSNDLKKVSVTNFTIKFATFSKIKVL